MSVSDDLQYALRSKDVRTPAQFAAADVTIETVNVSMRDGVKLATDLYLPPKTPAPVIAVRTPYGRDGDNLVAPFLAFARRGYVVAVQDLRGTGDSEPEDHDFYMFEPQDGYDFVEWVSAQDWCDGFIGSLGGSYVGQVQWPMARHPKMTTIVPEVSGIGVGTKTASLHMVVNALAHTIGHGEEKTDLPHWQVEPMMLDETLSTGFFNEPFVHPMLGELTDAFPALKDLSPVEAQAWLWAHYCSLSCPERAEFVRELTGSPHVTIVDAENIGPLFGQGISLDRHTLPSVEPARQVAEFQAIPLLRTGWYDWFINDALATFELLRKHAPEPLRSQARIIITPSSHNSVGYKERMGEHPELQHNHWSNVDFTLRWYQTVRDGSIDEWPRVIYYLMGANEWRSADDWPLPEAVDTPYYLGSGGTLTTTPPQEQQAVDQYVYDPLDPTPTVGGSIVSWVYPPGSVDVSAVQQRNDVLIYTTEPLAQDIDVVGNLRAVLHASSSAVDTDFAVRLSDVGPDGRAVQLQNGLLRARYRDLDRGAEPLVPGEVYPLEIDMWVTANRFKAGHRIRVDVSSADFPRFDRNTNLGGAPGDPVPATQTVYRDASHPSHILLPIVPVTA
ncbi:CocE/NonD family hydrolase [Kribbella sp. NPDC050281]|uniref:CocE/NonD family hydrolase n=1 Tax=Kribbella sp. NPDC050281 TaxID=3155515 RepID=UPI0033FA25AF